MDVNKQKTIYEVLKGKNKNCINARYMVNAFLNA